MKKVYLLLTLALLLLGSSSAWAACTTADAIASKRANGSGLLCDNAAVETYITGDIVQCYGDWCFSTPVALYVFPGADVTIPTLNETQMAFLETVALTTVSLRQNESNSERTGDINITNNFGTIVTGEYIGGVTMYNTWSGNITVTNNGNLFICDNADFSNATLSIVNNGGNVIIEGGKYSEASYNNIAAFLGEGYTVQRNSDGTYTVVEGTVIVKVGETGYADLFKAICASSPETPAVLQDAVESAAVNLPNDAIWFGYSNDFVLDMNGKNLTIASGCFKVDGKTLSISNSIPSAGGVITASGSSQKSIVEMYGAGYDTQNHAVLNIGKNVILKNTTNANYGISIFKSSLSDDAAYGVVVNIAGKVLTENGTALCINGMVQATDGHVPQINIAEDAVLGNIGDGCSLACIYAAGYGIWNIGAATLKANTPIYAKAGIINIDGADIEACGEFSEPTAYSGGFYPTGDAIILDTHKSYAGDMILNIVNDDTQIISAHGYAIHEAMTKAAADDASSAIGLTIQGVALIEGGDEVGAGNATKFTDRFTQALKDGSDSQYHWVVNGVSGGRYTSEPSVVAPGYEAEFNTTTGYWEVHPQSTPVPSKLYTIIVNTEWPATELTDNSEVLIKTGATLTVPSISVESGSTITVEPGAKLIAGENGITTADASGLILKADKDNGTGIVLFDGTTSNKQPMGTVELYLVAKKIDDYNYVWQHFGIPTTSAPTITRIEPVSYKDWDVKQGWIYTSGSAALTAPWVGHNVTTSAIAEGNIISFAGTLVGMTDATLNLSQTGYNCLSNSFTAPISVKSFVSGIGTSLTTDGMVWIYDPETDNFTKKNKASFILDPTDVFMPSMQGFFLLNSGASPIEVSLPYSNVETTAGLKDAAAYNGGIISLSNGVATSTLQILEGDEFSDEFENSFDGYQMPTGNIQIYAIQGADKLASIATNNIDGKEIEIVTTVGTEYSLSFSNLLGNAFKLKDLLTGDEIEVSEDNVYRFTAEPNSTLRRFKISEGEVSADEADADAVKVWVAESSLNIAGAVEGDAIEVINLAGVKVLSATATGEAVQAISLNGIASGAYIVKAGAATVKVIK